MGYDYKAIIERPQAGFENASDYCHEDAGRRETETGLSMGRLVALTCSIGGLQTVWLTIFSHGSSYLSSLGISEVHTSLIWTTAPICGAIVAPIVGVVSDSSRIVWGRRRPFVLMGAITTIIAISALSWIEPFTALLCSLHGEPSMAPMIMKYWAVFWITFLNVGIQSMQSGIRSLIVDVCPPEQQSLASAWAGRFTGLGNILGYLLGSLPLPFLVKNVEAWRFRCMSLFAVTVLSITTVITLYFIHEEVVAAPPEEDHDWVIRRTFRGIVQGMVSMPSRARSVCRVQFFSAMGWFGFLFYSTSYVSHLYLEETTENSDTVHSPAHKASGMRFATTASLLFAVVALSMNLILPRLTRFSGIDLLSQKRSFWTHLNSLRQPHILWALGHLLYTFLTFSTFAISSSTAGTATIATAGIAWGVTQWAPYALLGEEIASQNSDRGNVEELGGKRVAKEQNQNGAMLGVHTVAVNLPQILASIATSGIFWLAGQVGIKDAVGWVLRLSGIAGAVAAWFAYHL
ncbi:MFS general substrate transporter [Massarina eburnea CBS 473.64]|uniref:MFS general substrate transporter n=1 Tax=Massarina eburnea CBS 473.64 TaxID=1395130 RepID=A0A6A6RP36_9PLEO|nr:MFS general substrate transporter [Massarina eburnea CBS 473.64]